MYPDVREEEDLAFVVYDGYSVLSAQYLQSRACQGLVSGNVV
jgi:hypothetical protein